MRSKKELASIVPGLRRIDVDGVWARMKVLLGRVAIEPSQYALIV